MARLSVHLVTWNGAKYIPYLFDSLRKQTYEDWELLVIDNGSADGTVQAIEKEAENFRMPMQIIKNERNIGFAPGHNQAIRTTKGEYIQLLNQDMSLAPDYFEKVVAMMEAHPEAGAGQGVLLRWRFAEIQNDKMLGLSEVVDTMGLQVFRSRRVVDWRTGKFFNVIASEAGSHAEGRSASGGQSHDQGGEIATSPHYGGATRDDGVVEVFGVSGALPVYRRKAIEQVAFGGQARPNFTAEDGNLGGQVFDEDFFSYKEDVDLAFRLRSAGWKAYVEPQAQAWHDRTAAGPRAMTDKAALQNRKTKSAFVNYHSYKNHLMVLLKNEHPANFVKDGPWIIFYEFKKLIYLLLFDRASLKGLREVKKLWSRTMQKRKFIMENYKVRPEEIRKWYLNR